MAQSNENGSANKPKKPHRDFPLFAHGNGQWAKKVRGKQFFFGVWRDSDAALKRWLDVKDDLLAGRTPRSPAEGSYTLRNLCNDFLLKKHNLLNSGELSERSFRDYYRTCETVLGIFGRERLGADFQPDDFEYLRVELAKKRGLVALGNEIVRVRMLFKFAYDFKKIDKPMQFGDFKKPSKKSLRLAKRANGSRMFEADELRRIIEAAPHPLGAMTLLGINCGYGQSDVANLMRSAIDLDRGWVDYPRPKTGIDRKCPLWPETIAALREALQNRTEPKATADQNLMFVTRIGNRWVRMSQHENPGKRVALDSVSKEFGKLLKRLDITGNRNFYALRHSFETIGGESRDQISVNSIMGHVDNSMAGVYRERISDERLKAVVNTVHKWLFPESE